MSDLIAEDGADRGADLPGPVHGPEPGPKPKALIPELASLSELLALAQVMAQTQDEGEILGLALGAVGRLTRCRPLAGCLRRDGRLVRWPPGAEHAPTAGQPPLAVALHDIEAQVEALSGRAGELSCRAVPWVGAYPLPGRTNAGGYLVIGAEASPTGPERSVLGALAQTAGAALVGARFSREQRERHGWPRVATAQLPRAHERSTTSNEESTTSNQELASANVALAARSEQLETIVAELRHQVTIDEVLTQAAASGQGEAGIAAALHGLTGLAVAVEDPFGNLRAWAGPDRPERYPKPRAADRTALLGRAQRHSGPLRAGNRLLALARSAGEVLGVLALVDPVRRIGPRERHALERASAELGIELAHQRSLAETELRLRRDLVEDLIAGTDEPSVYTRAAALGHDLHHPHWVVTLVAGDGALDATVTAGIEWAMAGLQMPALLTTGVSGTVIMIAHRPAVAVCPARLHREIRRELGPVAVGVGGPAEGPAEIARSYTQARRALNFRKRSRAPDGLTVYDQLGLYRILTADPAQAELDDFLHDQLGALLDYDSTHRAELVKTLAVYLDHGGNYDNTAHALVIHRSTLRYRLHRIRDISGHDLTAVDTRLHLHLATRAWALFHDPS